MPHAGRPRTFALALLASAALGIHLSGPARGDDAPRALAGVKRVVFLGDSITYAGGYVEDVEAYLRLKYPGLRVEFLDLGLPSETVSGLSEPGHANGAFPRPDLHERLDRVLARTKPDLVVACYGMNDGIYYPFGEDRFARYQQGITRLRDEVKAAGAKLVHLTPPVFDPEPIRARTLPAGRAEYRQPYEGYDEVLGGYSGWLLAKRADGWDVVDVHGPMKQYLEHERARDPKFRLAGDGVHTDATGHWLIARALLTHWGVAGDLTDARTAFAAFPRGPEVRALVQKKQRVLKDAWLTSVGHKRPGMAKGKALDEAEGEAKALDTEIRARTAKGR